MATDIETIRQALPSEETDALAAFDRLATEMDTLRECLKDAPGYYPSGSRDADYAIYDDEWAARREKLMRKE